jgi:hypothetical protein
MRIDIDYDSRISCSKFIQCMKELMQMAAEPSAQQKKHLYYKTVSEALTKTVAVFFNYATISDSYSCSQALGSWSRHRPLDKHTTYELRNFFHNVSQYLCLHARFHQHFLRWTRVYFFPVISAFLTNSSKNKLKRELIKNGLEHARKN